MRETYEEIGIHSSNIQILGSHSPLPNIKLISKVTPFIGFLGSIVPSDIRFNQDEVSAIFTVSIDKLINTAKHSTVQWRNTTAEYSIWDAPSSVNPEGDLKIWGMTAFFLHNFIKDILLENQNYNKL